MSQEARWVAARRAADDDALLAEFDLLEDEGDKISVAALVKQGVTAVLVACLAVFVAVGVSAVSAPYSTGVTTDGAAISGSSDVTRGQPSTPGSISSRRTGLRSARRAPESCWPPTAAAGPGLMWSFCRPTGRASLVR